MRKAITTAILFLLIAVGATMSFSNRSVVVFPNGMKIEVEIADTTLQRERGLSGRERLDENNGMLFLHGDEEIRYYWMKGMKIPIDIIWIRGSEVTGFHERAQVDDPPYELFSSGVPVDKVLEVSEGFVERNNIKRGDLLDIRISAR